MTATDAATQTGTVDAPGPRSEQSRVKRLPQRASYDDPTIHAVLDAALVGHVGFVAHGRPLVIPMLYGRDGDVLYLHGSVASRLQRSLAGGIDVCLTVTVVDGLVLARSAFHHSMNYRSVVVLGTATKVDGDEKVHGLRVITEHLAPGRWAESRPPTEPELKVTSVLRLAIDEASAKVRVGGPVDDDEDLGLPVWAGVVPCRVTFSAPEPDEHVPADLAPSPAALALNRRHRMA
jgi:nitroimidazol reductase NimA-like FMN-containing flavoprotein (pyridoxamine 5'-phosphate oxidase superfamily)